MILFKYKSTVTAPNVPIMAGFRNSNMMDTLVTVIVLIPLRNYFFSEDLNINNLILHHGETRRLVKGARIMDRT